MHRDPGFRRRHAVPLLCCAVLFLSVAWLFVALELRHGERSPTVAIVGDLLTQYHVIMDRAFAWLRAGTLPLWNPYLSCGTPFAAASHQGFVYPLYLPYLLTDGATAMDLEIALHIALACLGVTLLARHLGQSWPAAAVAGLIYGFQGSMMIKVYFMEFVASAAWIPWTFLTVDRVLVRASARRAAALAGVFGLSVLGGHGVQFIYFTAWALLPLVLVRSWQLAADAGGAAVARAHGVLAAGAALGILLAFVRIVPFAEHIGESWRPAGNLSMEILDLLTTQPDAFLESLFSPEPPPASRSPFSPVDGWRQAYVGTLPLVLAGIGLLTWRPRAVALAFAAAGAGAVLYAFGSRGGVAWILYYFPLGSWFRGFDRSLIVFGMVIAVLSGAGLDYLLGFDVRASQPRALRLRRVGAAIAMTALVVIGGFAAGQASGHARLAAYGVVGVGLLILAVAAARHRGARVAVAAGLGGLILVDLLHAERFSGVLPSVMGGYYERYGDFFDAIRQRQGYDRTYIWSNDRWGQPLFFFSDIGKAGLVHRVYLSTDYDTTGSQRSADYLGTLGRQIPHPNGYVTITPADDNIGLLRLLGVRFFLMDDAQEARLRREYPALLAQSQLILHRGGISLYEYGESLPRAFIAAEVAVVPADQTLARMRRADLARLAFVEDPAFPGLPPAGAAPGRADITSYEPNRVVVQTHSDAPGLMVLTDQYYPGWRATLDGAPAAIHRADFLFRGVAVPAGDHTVEFTYRPLSWVLGAAGSGLACILMLLLLRGR